MRPCDTTYELSNFFSTADAGTRAKKNSAFKVRRIVFELQAIEN